MRGATPYSLQNLEPRLRCTEILSPEAHIATKHNPSDEKESHKTKIKGYGLRACP